MRSARGLPGGLTRLARRRLGVASAAIVILLAVASASLAEATHVRIDQQVDENWRGAYDILVRPNGARLDLESTGGLVEPNFASFAGSGGIGLDELETIRAIPGVDVAAPIATVGRVGYIQQAPQLYIEAEAYPDEVTLYRYEFQAVTFDGTSEIILQTESGRVLLGPGRRSAYDMRAGSATPAGNMDLTLLSLPAITSTIVAIDPEAERRLLPNDVSFLRSLAAVDGSPRSAAEFDPTQIPESLGNERTMFEWYRQDGPMDRPVIPIVVSEQLFSPLMLRLQISQVGEELDNWPAGASPALTLDGAEEAVGAGLRPLGTVDLDLTNVLQPFGMPPMTLLWPGSQLPDASEGQSFSAGRVPQLSASLLERPTYGPGPQSVSSPTPRFRVRPQGPTLIAHEEAAALFPAQPQQTYRRQTSVPLAVAVGFTSANPLDAPFLLAPVGTFDLQDLDLQTDALSYVPLGAYDPPDTTLIADPSGGAVDRVSMTPSLNPAGLVGVPPLAITDLRGARALRGEDPIDAIRVRVSELDGYNAAGVAKVERVASQIAAMGLDVDVVAGSSQRSVELFVERYRFDELVTSEELEMASLDPLDLGWVRQEWSTLGAAERVERGLGNVNAALLLLALMTGAVFAVALQVTQFAARVREIAVLRAIGWSRWRILRWTGAESGLIGLGAFIAGAAAWTGTGGSLWGLLAAGGIGVLMLMSGVVATVVAERRAHIGAVQSGDAWSGGPNAMVGRVRGSLSFARRAVVGRPARSLPILLALAVGSSTSVLGVSLVVGAIAQAGPTRLAAGLTAVLAPAQLTLLGLTAAGGLALAAALTRIDLDERANEFRILAGSGWSPGSVRALLRRERVLVAVPAALLSGAGTAWLAAPVALTDSGLTAVAAALGALSFVVWGEPLAVPGASAGRRA